MSTVETAANVRLSRVVFTGRLLTLSRAYAHALVEAAGGKVTSNVSRRTSLLVVGLGGWPVLPDGTVSRSLLRGEQLREQGAHLEIVSETRFLDLVNGKPSAAAHAKSFTAERVADLLGISQTTLNRWQAQGLIEAHDGCFDFQDLVALRTIAKLLNDGVAPTTIASSIRSLASVIEVDRPLAQLNLISCDGAVKAEVGSCFLDPSGQFELNFDFTEEDVADPIALREADVTEPMTSEGWFNRGVAFEQQDRFSEAIEAYMTALAGEPEFPEAHFNLGNVLRNAGRLEAAETHYRMAINLQSDWAEAHFNLADVLEELGRLNDARTSLRSAIQCSPDFADAHFNLALLSEQLNDSNAAIECWRAYLRIDPESEWAEDARIRLRSLSG